MGKLVDRSGEWSWENLDPWTCLRETVGEITGDPMLGSKLGGVVTVKFLVLAKEESLVEISCGFGKILWVGGERVSKGKTASAERGG